MSELFDIPSSPSEVKEAIISRLENGESSPFVISNVKLADPEFIGRYANTNFSHVTNLNHARQVEIEGFKPGGHLVDPEDIDFFMQAFYAYHGNRTDPNDKDWIDTHILPASERWGNNVFFKAGEVTDNDMYCYVVPESLKYFMRNLMHFAKRYTDHPEMHGKALEIVGKYWTPLVDEEARVVNGAVIRVNPLNPSLVTSVLGNMGFEKIAELSAVAPSLADSVYRNALSNTNIPVKGPIPAADIVIAEQFTQPLDEQRSYVLESDAFSVFGNKIPLK